MRGSIRSIITIGMAGGKGGGRTRSSTPPGIAPDIPTSPRSTQTRFGTSRRTAASKDDSPARSSIRGNMPPGILNSSNPARMRANIICRPEKSAVGRAIESFGDLSARDLRMMARETRAHLAGLDGMFVPWRSALLSKLVYELDEPRQPVPDGLSLRYLALAADMRRVAERRDGPAFRGDDQVAFGERAIQDEIAKAQQLERRLLDRISRIGAGRRS